MHIFTMVMENHSLLLLFCTKKNLGSAAGTTVALGLSDSFWFFPGSWFPLGSPAPGPRCLCSTVGFAPNLLIPGIY